MGNEITIDIEKIRKLPNNSVTNAETIRQISLYSLQNPNDKEIIFKIDSRFTVSGLYPHIMSYQEYSPEKANEITKLSQKYLKHINKKIK